MNVPPPVHPQRRRADAERSRAAIVDAAVRLLGARPEAGMAAIAEAAGVTRQTVYAHFASRGELVRAVRERLTAGVAAELAAARPDEGPAQEALVRVLAVDWRIAERYGLPPRTRPAPPPLLWEALAGVVLRGQREGAFDAALDPEWAVPTLIALTRAAAADAASGRITPARASSVVTAAALRLLGAG